MSKKMEELQNKIDEVDKDQLTEVVQKVKDASDNGEITDDEKDQLVEAAKERLGEPFSGFNI